jgi:predicted RNA binding protein YcfA (HicA-like mRNA interferase family)
LKLALATGEELAKIAGKIGFLMVHRAGSHTIWKHEDGRTTTIPLHQNRDLPRGLVRKILKDMDLSVEDYLKIRK